MARVGLTTERVVDAAAELADREGVEGVTLARLADELGVRTPSLYNHVGGLDDLRRRLTHRTLVALGQELAQAAVGKAREDAVRAFAAAYRAFAHAHPGLYATTVPSSEVADPAVQAAGREILATVIAVLGGFGLTGDEALHATRALRSLLHGFVALELAGGFAMDLDLDESFDWLVDLAVSGLDTAAAVL